MKERGIRQTGSGWQVYVRVRGEFRSKHFPPDTELEDLKQWRDETQFLTPRNAPLPGTLAGDVAKYLKVRAGMRSIQDRTLHLEDWRDALGPRRDRHAITPLDIRSVLEDWRTAKKLSNPSLNRRRTALMSLYTVLDPSTPNPVRLVPRYRETTKPLRLPSRADILSAIDTIGRDKNRTSKADVLKGRLTRARLLALFWTGWPAAQLMRLRKSDIHWQEQTALVRGRQKGSGTRDVILPLVPQAVTALKQLQALDALGESFSTSSLHKSLKAACVKLGLPAFNPYALRHRFLTDLALLTRDDRTVAELGMHTSAAQTRRYTESSVPQRLRDAVAQLQKSCKPGKPRTPKDSKVASAKTAKRETRP